MEKEEQRLSSEMLKRKRTKESGSQAPIPEEKSKREAPVEQLWERSREGRKETNRKAEYLESDGRYGKPDWKEEEKQESESGTEKPRKPGCKAETVEKRKRKMQRLSSWKPKTEADERKRKSWKNT